MTREKALLTLTGEELCLKAGAARTRNDEGQGAFHDRGRRRAGWPGAGAMRRTRCYIFPGMGPYCR